MLSSISNARGHGSIVQRMACLVKICGLRRAEDARLAVELGASALGFVFWPESPRFIDPYRALEVLRAVPPFVTTVGVFVDQSPDYVKGVAQLLNLGAVQLHGNEAVSSYTGARRVIKAVAVGDGQDLEKSLRAVPDDVTVLLDAHDPVKRGGTGHVIDWTQAAAVARSRRVILAGGLHAENVRSATDIVRPYAVDVSSGVEASPGVKDPEKIRAFFAALTTD